MSDQWNDYLAFAILGYLCGSILFANIVGHFFLKKDIAATSDDHNPGVANVFKYGSIPAGIVTLLLELSKGFTPVFLAARYVDVTQLPFALVMVAPVLGHAFPLLRPKKGGKAIAVSFGSLLGMIPTIMPVLLLVFFYLFYSLVVVIQPHLHRSIFTFASTSVSAMFALPCAAWVLGMVCISFIVILKHAMAYHGEVLKVTTLRKSKG